MSTILKPTAESQWVAGDRVYFVPDNRDKEIIISGKVAGFRLVYEETVDGPVRDQTTLEVLLQPDGFGEPMFVGEDKLFSNIEDAIVRSFWNRNPDRRLMEDAEYEGDDDCSGAVAVDPADTGRAK